jgi:hypothetical protein
MSAPRMRPAAHALALAITAVIAAAASAPPAAAQPDFPTIPVWSYPGVYQAGADTVLKRPRTLTVRWLRDPAAEAREDFAGYRIYRVHNEPDTSRMMLLRRYARQPGDASGSVFLWHLPPINASTPLPQRVATFIDPDSSGSYEKVCRRRDELGRCLSRGDSILVLIAPPGPHNGFRTWYSITYEGLNTAGNDYLDLFLPDTVGCVHCPSFPCPDRNRCPNLNHKARNVTSAPTEPTPGPATDLERVTVVPNPYRAHEAWDQPGGSEVHFVNLPPDATVLIYTTAGDLVRELKHRDLVRDFERWDLKNAAGRDVSSGIYVYRVVSGTFTLQDRFVVIR